MSTPEWIKNIRGRIGHDLICVTGVDAFVEDDQRRVLLQRRMDNGTWEVPGGLVDPGESVLDAVLRETFEETGAKVEIIRLCGVYSAKPTHIFPNGDQASVINIAFHCRYLSGTLRSDGEESMEVAFFALDQLPEALSPLYRRQIQHAFHGSGVDVI